MQIEQIETFLDLCETRSFHATAERLGVTQSTVSGRLRALEAALGRRLLARSRAGTEPTTDGLRFEPHARLMLHHWAEARHAARQTVASAITMRIGLQHDLAGNHIGQWAQEFRDLLPQARFYIEPDYSVQMVANVIAGELDLAVVYSPRAHPDLHFESLGEVAYRMVSTEAALLAAVRDETYILAAYSPAFARAHDTLLPGLAGVAVASGQEAAVAGLLLALGGSAYVLAETAEAMASAGQARPVAQAPVIRQTVYAAIHLRNRHRGPHRRMIQALRTHFGSGPAGG